MDLSAPEPENCSRTNSTLSGAYAWVVLVPIDSGWIPLTHWLWDIPGATRKLVSCIRMYQLICMAGTSVYITVTYSSQDFPWPSNLPKRCGQTWPDNPLAKTIQNSSHSTNFLTNHDKLVFSIFFDNNIFLSTGKCGALDIQSSGHCFFGCGFPGYAFRTSFVFLSKAKNSRPHIYPSPLSAMKRKKCGFKTCLSLVRNARGSKGQVSDVKTIGVWLLLLRHTSCFRMYFYLPSKG